MPSAIDKTPPKCPMCASASELKEVLKHSDSYHYFFRCLVCAVVFPIIEMIAARKP